jgi:hypothetical protein
MKLFDAKACLSFLDRPSLFKSYTEAEEATIRDARAAVSAGEGLDMYLSKRLTDLVGRVAG